jgi:hypothetical protein
MSNAMNANAQQLAAYGNNNSSSNQTLPPGPPGSSQGNGNGGGNGNGNNGSQTDVKVCIRIRPPQSAPHGLDQLEEGGGLSYFRSYNREAEDKANGEGRRDDVMIIRIRYALVLLILSSMLLIL